MYKIVKASEAIVRDIADNKIARNLITKDISLSVSLAVTEATDYYEKETTLYNRIYYVTEGTMSLTIGNDTQDIETGDACYIEKDTTYEMQGTFKAITVNQPAFGS